MWFSNVCASNSVLCSLQQIISTKIAAIKEEINKQKWISVEPHIFVFIRKKKKTKINRLNWISLHTHTQLSLSSSFYFVVIINSIIWHISVFPFLFNFQNLSKLCLWCSHNLILCIISNCNMSFHDFILGIQFLFSLLLLLLCSFFYRKKYKCEDVFISLEAVLIIISHKLY